MGGYEAQAPLRTERLGQPIALADAQIAAMALAHQALLATRHTKDFEGLGLTLINPWLVT